RLREAIAASSPERMRELEKLQSQQWVVTKNKRDDIPFVGTASTESWKELLTRSSVAKIESAWGDLMVALGYELATVSPSAFRDSFLGRIRIFEASDEEKLTSKTGGTRTHRL
ncbi:MAG TPA: hypothetical protein VI386_15195, partial [Candidatus Sulfotelmatobacter sp.]